MITVVGSLNYDLVTTIQQVPNGGETLHAENFEMHRGGKGANEAFACARLTKPGIPVKMIGCVGEDHFGEDLIRCLGAEGVDTSCIQRTGDVRTGIATIIVETSGENRILVYPGANSKVTSDQVTSETLESAHYVLFQNEIPLETTLAALRLAHESGKATVWNPSPLPKVDRLVWQYVDYLVVNEGEAAKITGLSVDDVDQAKTAVTALLDLGVGTAVITLGPNGAVYGNKKESTKHQGARKVSPVDTTGAGDTFLGAFVAALSGNETLSDSIAYAIKASGLAVTKPGAMSSIPTREDVDRA